MASTELLVASGHIIRHSYTGLKMQTFRILFQGIGEGLWNFTSSPVPGNERIAL